MDGKQCCWKVSGETQPAGVCLLRGNKVTTDSSSITVFISINHASNFWWVSRTPALYIITWRSQWHKLLAGESLSICWHIKSEREIEWDALSVPRPHLIDTKYNYFSKTELCIWVLDDSDSFNKFISTLSVSGKAVILFNRK